MPIDHSALGSLAATLNDLVERIGDAARQADEEDDAGIELLEVERQLQTSSRRLDKIVHRLSGR